MYSSPDEKAISDIVEKDVFRAMLESSEDNSWDLFDKLYVEATRKYDLDNNHDFRQCIIVAIFHRIENCRLKFGKNWRDIYPTLKDS